MNGCAPSSKTSRFRSIATRRPPITKRRYAQLDVVVRRDTRVALGHRLLHRDRAAHCIDDAGELYQHAVAGGLDDAAVVLGDLRIEKLTAQCLEAFERAFLVR